MPKSVLAFTWRDMWDNFPHKDRMDKELYKNIISTFNHMLMRDIIDNGAIRKMPYGLGALLVHKRSLYGRFTDKAEEYVKTRLPIHYASYRKTKEKFLLNYRHTNNYVASIRWTKKIGCTLKTRALYAFRPLKVFRKYIAYSVREKNTIEKYWDLT